MSDMGDAIEILKRAQTKAQTPSKLMVMASAMPQAKDAPVYDLTTKNGTVVKMMVDSMPAPGKRIISE